MSSEDGFRFTITQENAGVYLRIEGDLYGRGAGQVQRSLDQLCILSKDAKLTVDLGGMGDFDYFGVVTFAKEIRAQMNRFREVCLTGLEGSYENLFKRFGLKNVEIALVLPQKGRSKG